MGEHWDRLARSDALASIDPTLGSGVSEAAFVAAGAAHVEWLMAWVGDAVGRERALEIGCGIGRTTVHLADHFARVDCVDVSAEMVRRARARGLPRNVTLTVTSGRDLRHFPDASFDFVLSHLVLQHVADESVLAEILTDVARVLRPNGRAMLQFDTRGHRPLAAVVGVLPDALLPAKRRRAARRYSRTCAHVRELVAAAGLAIEREEGAGSAEHLLFLSPGRPG
jgi:ubiquinone/menaquinone biosynthesis C-methylase UbiE